MAGKNKLRLWLLTDGAPGHWSQSQGIADALAQRGDIDIEVFRVELKVCSSFWKRLGRLCLPWIRDPDFWLPRVYQITPPSAPPDLIISSGANTLLANALLARREKAPNAYSGTLKGYDAAAYRVIFSVVSLGVQNNYVLPLPPVPAAIFNVPAQVAGAEPMLAVLIGGDGAGYRFRAEDWCTMAQWLSELARTRGARLLLTTSRRTGAEAEQLLKAGLPAECLAQAVWWSELPQPVVSDFLSRCTAVVVTEDSLTMIAESIYARREVFTLAPQHAAANDNDSRALAAYAESGLIQRIGLAQMTAKIPGVTVAAKTFPDVPALIRSALQPYLPGSLR